MAVSVQIVSIINEAPAGAAALPLQRILVNFSDGTQLEFQDLAAFQEWARGFETVDTAQRMACARLVAISPGLKNTSQIVGKTCTLDATNVSMFRIQ